MSALIRSNIVVAISMLAATASAQDTRAMDLDALLARAAEARSSQQLGNVVEAIGALGPVPDLLPRLLATNPNAYVYALQSRLRDNGYAAPLSGMLGRTTLGVLGQFCADNDIAATCGRGPLLPDVALTIDAALGGAAGPAAVAEPADAPAPANTEPATAPAEPVPAPAPEPPPAPASDPVLPAGWSIDDRSSVGVDATVLAAAASGATVRLEGEPTTDGWFNIYLSPAVPVANSASWSASLGAAAAEGLSGQAQTVRFLTARLLANGTYLGELFPGIALATAAAPVEVTATAPGGTELLQPYVQVRFAAGAPLTVTLTIDSPALTATD